MDFNLFFIWIFENDIWLNLFFCIICVCLCHTVVSVSFSLVVTCWERVDLLTLIYVMFSCVFGVLCQVWYLVLSIPNRCLFP